MSRGKLDKTDKKGVLIVKVIDLENIAELLEIDIDELKNLLKEKVTS